LTPKYDSADLTQQADGLTSVSYSGSLSRKFSITSTNGALIGQQKPYSVTATFVNYAPGLHENVSQAKASNLITFVDPCIESSNLVLRETPNPTPDNFSGNNIIVQVR
jgi:hypothetical protein